MSVVDDCSAFIQSSELALASSKTRPYLRPGEVYALRTRVNGNPCGPLSTCIYMYVRPVTCSPCEVDLSFNMDLSDSRNASPQNGQGQVAYNNSTGVLRIINQNGTLVPNSITFRAVNNRLTCFNLDETLLTLITDRQVDSPTPTNAAQDHCCTPETSYYARLLPASCSPRDCDADVDCVPCCGSDTASRLV